MIATAQQVQMAAKLYEARDAMRRLLGERYAARMAELGGAIRKVADRDQVNEIQATMCGHSPVDAGDHAASHIVAEARAALSNTKE